MSKAGRPKVTIDWSMVDKLCVIQATLEDIATWFDCSVDTIERACKRDKKMNIAEYFALKRGKGRVGLRRKQYEVAMAGSIPMLIWLGKQYLGQKDLSRQEITGKDGEPIQTKELGGITPQTMKKIGDILAKGG